MAGEEGDLVAKAALEVEVVSVGPRRPRRLDLAHGVVEIGVKAAPDRMDEAAHARPLAARRDDGLQVGAKRPVLADQNLGGARPAPIQGSEGLQEMMWDIAGPDRQKDGEGEIIGRGDHALRRSGVGRRGQGPGLWRPRDRDRRPSFARDFAKEFATGRRALEVLP